MNVRSIETDYRQTGVTKPLLEVRAAEKDYYRVLKRAADIVISLMAILLSAPLVLTVGILIRLESPGSIIYKQIRVGQFGKLFVMYKLRSMRHDSEVGGPRWAAKDDPRVTRVGRFIRKTRMDEIPQFYNVLIGNMSVVGPRPERPAFTLLFNQQYPGFINRLQVKPGITGWAQVNGGYENNPREKAALDLYYIRNRGLMLDLKILLKTILVVLSGHGAR
ncbi:MAG TPA: exopolysaccharide biosynthesis polyprenyl glycosylphosphotransferase [Bacillota bacterium]|nr:exopolysaccharide biosynthesis polyprenyl glycosylphosphotransferase [Bacillota bacterium]